MQIIWLVPALPLFGFVVLFFFGRRFGEPAAGWFATLMTAAAFFVTLGIWLDMLSKPADERSLVKTLFVWVPAGRLHVDIAFLVDPLSVTMALFVTGISALIHLYSIGYMHGDRDFSKFFLYLNLFVFSMLMLVLGDNLLVTFLGWEGVGVCSYFLVSFWFTRVRPPSAGKKAFITNRIGDWGFMIAMFLAFQATGTLNYEGIFARADTLATSTITAICLLLFLGAVGKSAQFPLYLWLPDAMEGPTPVSALIHAATMVTAGVYLMCRISPLLAQVPDVGTVIAIVGAFTALFAATCAVAQNDIKKVLAYSTVSQLGYMFLAVGAGAYTAGVFHMVTHAFFKATLFLGAGAVIHGMPHEDQDLRHMGALRKVMPITAVTFIIAWLAIAGVPPFAGFWSKDEILVNVWDKSPLLWLVGELGALLTAYYMSREVFLAFFGKARWNEAREDLSNVVGPEGGTTPLVVPAPEQVVPQAVGAAVNELSPNEPDEETHPPHEAPWTMTVPLIILSIGGIFGGLLNLPFSDDTKFLEKWLEPVTGEFEHHLTLSGAAQWTFAIVSAAVGIIGIYVAWLVYDRHRIKAVEPAVLQHAWYYDDTISAFVAGPGEESFEDVAWFDQHVIDGAVNDVGKVSQLTGRGLRLLQTGYIRNYALGIGIGAVALLAWFVSRGI
jgi:NADH-quinone oxidoreductase subunit L